MFTRLKNQWRELRSGKPGSRFEDRYRGRNERRSAFTKLIYLVLGVFLVLAGLVLLPAPGPGLPVVIVGGGMLAEESLFVARALDRLELGARLIVAHARGTLKRY